MICHDLRYIFYFQRAKTSSASMMAMIAKKPEGRREELLKQLKAVEDAIARKKGKPIP